MRLAINGRFLSQRTTGVQRVAREFTRALDTLLADGLLDGIEARLLVPANADIDGLSLRAISVEVLKGAHGHAWEQFVLPRHVDGDWLLNLGNSAPLLSLLRNRRVAVVVHDLSYRLHPKAYARHYRLLHAIIDPLVMRCARTIFTVSDTERAMLLSLYPSAGARTFTALNGAWPGDAHPVAVPRTPAHPAAGRGYGLYVGSLSQRKNIKGVLSAAIRLARTRGLRFKIVGGGSAILARPDLGLPDDISALIELHGQVESVDELAAIYRGAAFLLFPSFYEAGPLPPVEAMAQACPVIASDIASLRERCGAAALYCDPYDEKSIIDAAEQILDDKALADTLRDEGLRRASALSWRAQARTMIDTLVREERSLAAASGSYKSL